MAVSVREKQAVSLKSMLNFNVPPTKSSAAEPQWKVLIYDRCGQDIISPLLSVKELRDSGVTLHLLLHSDRETIPDVPAIYFVLPTDENIQRICKDLHKQMYDTYYLNFISPIPRPKLEELANASLQSNSVTQIGKVYDQYLNFISLESDMFILKHQDREAISFYSINKGDVKDTDMESIMDKIVESLFCVFVTLGVVPIIRCPSGNAAEMVAEKLDKKMRENIRDARSSLFTTDLQSGQLNFQRPLLVILDRNMDLATLFHHTWTYQALIHDVLNLKLNSVEIEDDSAGGAVSPKSKTKSYDLNQNDLFWQQQRGSPFPTVAEAVQEELDTYRAKESEVTRLKTAMGLEGGEDEAISMISDNTDKLTSAVSSLPELLEKKRLIDMHTNVATALLEHIKTRKLDVYFEMEEKLMSTSTLDKSLMDIISDPDAGTPEDKLRLFLIAILCGPAMSETEIDQYCVALQAANCQLDAVEFVKRLHSYSKMTEGAGPSQYGGGGTKTIGMFTKLMSQASAFAMEGVKNLVVKKHKLPVTRIVDSLMEMKSLSETDDYRYFDPKMLRATETIPRNKSPFQDAMVFVVGGGNYIEYQNLLDNCGKAKTGGGSHRRHVTYGTTELLNANQFLKQLAQLGREMTSH